MSHTKKKLLSFYLHVNTTAGKRKRMYQTYVSTVVYQISVAGRQKPSKRELTHESLCTTGTAT